MIYPLVRELAVDGIPVTVACRVLGFSTQAFYRWCANPVTQRDWDDAHFTNAAWDACRWPRESAHWWPIGFWGKQALWPREVPTSGHATSPNSTAGNTLRFIMRDANTHVDEQPG